MSIESKLKDLPSTPGVYIMRDSLGTVIYVGKAVVLKNRVRQYFQNTEKPVKVQAMVDNIADFEYIITRTEKDALALENNLIKKYKPHYNILLKDDKTSPYIRIDTRKEFPCIEVTRRVKRDGARYFGPFIGVSVRDVIAVLQSAYRLRTCGGTLKKRSRPCLNHDLGLCLAPCCDDLCGEEYRSAVNCATSFLSGGSDDISGEIERRMLDAAQNENFERAISYRNQLKVLQTLKSKVVGELGSIVNIDTVYYTDNGLYGAVSVCIVRGGKMMGVKNYIIDEPQVFGGDMTTFLPQYYSMTNELPDEICLQAEIDTTALSDYFKTVFSKTPMITFPQKGMRKKLLDTAEQNCRDFLLKSADRVKRENDMTVGACDRLAELLHLPSVRRIECFDISDISGTDKVASQTVFIDGKAEKSFYRRYRIRTVEGADDFRSMYEAISRRLMRYKSGDSGFNELPDLIVIDGGLEQVEFACRAADDVGVHTAFVGLAKRDEELWLRGASEPIRLKRDDYALKLLQRIRDEAHRFAVLYHRTVRSKRYESELKGISGVGSSTIKKVLEKFNTRTIVTASVSELVEKAGITQKAAKSIYEYYHPEEIEVKMKKYKMVACDLDGTLLNDDLKVSQRNLDAINEFRANGGIFTVATGRAPSGVKNYIQTLGLDSNIVKMACYLGCAIVDSGTLENDELVTISNADAAKIIELTKNQSAFSPVYYDGGVMIEEMNDKARIFFDAVGIQPRVVGNLVENVKNTDDAIIKVLLVVDERVVADIAAMLQKEFPHIDFVQSTAPLLDRMRGEGEDYQPTLIECINANGSKGEALKKIAKLHGVDISEVIAFGDSFNDVSMLKAAGLGVAMGNARQPIKIAADVVTGTNNEDGVAQIIERYCLGKEE